MQEKTKRFKSTEETMNATLECSVTPFLHLIARCGGALAARVPARFPERRSACVRVDNPPMLSYDKQRVTTAYHRKGGGEMASVTVNEDLCKGCGLCIVACPKHIMIISNTQINPKGYHTALCGQPKECIGCAFCATMCPEVAIRVEK
jgi:2-oxoglutarate ferredoxin oxidoreductase subunit delta